MPFQGLQDGIYLVRQKSIRKKDIDHYGVLDIGNRLNLANADGFNPVVIHQAPPQIRVDNLEDTGSWELLEQSIDEKLAENRFWKACENPIYFLGNNNCEHFARYVVCGIRESKQLQGAVIIIGVFALALHGLTRQA